MKKQVVTRMQAEIVARIKARERDDVFGFEVDQYFPFLDFEHVRPWLKPGVKPEDWEPRQLSDLHATMVEYMAFAWEKANGFRGISANRSIGHYIAWLWLDGADDLAARLADDAQYEYYGKDLLREVCDYLGVNADLWDDGVRRNEESE